MPYWTTYAKKLLEKVLSENSAAGSRPNRVKCKGCGILVHPLELENEKCSRCIQEESRQKYDFSNYSREGQEKSEKRRAEERPQSPAALSRAYEILGAGPTDSDDALKKKYRKLVKECHVDNLPKDLPDYLVKEANRRFQEVQEAYEQIVEERKR